MHIRIINCIFTLYLYTAEARSNTCMYAHPILRAAGLQNASWPEMTDIINILIRCEFAYYVEFGFICDY